MGLHSEKPEMANPMEYYQNQIMAFQHIIPERRRIQAIEPIADIIPGALCFIVGWDDFNAGRGEGFDILNASPRGNIFGLYAFDANHHITNEYQVGYKNYLDSIRTILMEKMPGKKPEYGMISYGDFNNDGINEVASMYLCPPHYEYVFSVFGFDVTENDLVPLLFAPIYIHFERPYPPVEPIENGFRILEVTDKEAMDLAWNDYVWDSDIQRYTKR